jgi:hypothetical protein
MYLLNRFFVVDFYGVTSTLRRMVKTSIQEYVASVNRAHDNILAKFNEGIKEGAYLHTLQWQTANVALVIHEKAQADSLGYLAEKFDGAALVGKLVELRESLTRALIGRASGHRSTCPISNEMDQQQTHAMGHVLEKLDNILRYDEDVAHTTTDAAQKALNVIALDPAISKWLHKNDPKALEQVQAARDLNKTVTK